MSDTTSVWLCKRKMRLKSGKTVAYRMLRWHGREIDAETGRPKLYSESLGQCTKAEGERWRAQKIADLAGGKALLDRPRKVTLAQFIEDHQNAIRNKVRGATLAEYRIAGDHAMAALGAEMSLDRIDYAHVRSIEARLEKLKRSRSTIRKTLSTLRAMFNRAVMQKLILSNPFSGYGLPTSEAKEARIFSRDEIDALVDAAPIPWWKALIRLAADSGLRKMELLHLRWSDIDFDGGTLDVASRRGGSFKADDVEYPIVAWSAKAKASYRIVPLPERTLMMLRRMKLAGDSSEYVFLSLHRLTQLRRYIDQDGALPAMFDVVPNVWRDFRVIQNRAKIAKPFGSLHDLRKSYGTYMAAFQPMHVLREFMGHSQITTTATYYLRTTEDDADRAREALNGAAVKNAI